MSERNEFEILLRGLGEFDENQISRIADFRDEVVLENSFQNLTRLLTPADFFEGHVLDVVELKRSGLLSFPALDLGAGMGVPGLLYALIYGLNSHETIISCDSEKMKADFSQKMIDQFAIKAIISVHSRAETYLSSHSVDTIFARAVGPVGRIHGWIEECSTWNKLLLMKGPKWEEEWSEFRKTSRGKRLNLGREHRYKVGLLEKSRVLVELIRK
ncbi:MAG: class I SAM-dependent methyltransferase [Cryobacterium sp.]|nr:class I SAM-dependent methyltransferase [Oligoflexia bacterium]